MFFLNGFGTDAVEAWLDKVQKIQGRESLHAWVEAADRAANNASPRDSCVVLEMRGFDTAAGTPAVLYLPWSAFDKLHTYALLDNDAGLVWWVGDASDPESACVIADAETNQGECRGVWRQIPRQSGPSGYVVYAVPAGFDVPDGADPAGIRAVEAFECIGLFVPDEREV